MIETPISKIGKNKRIDVKSICRLNSDGLQRRVVEIALQVQNEWRNAARGTLNTTATDYINNINIDYNFRAATAIRATASVILKGTVPNMVEQGFGPAGVGSYGPVDLRVFLLKGRKYVDVPFDRTKSDIMNFGDMSKPFSFDRKGTTVSGVGAMNYANALESGERMAPGFGTNTRPDTTYMFYGAEAQGVAGPLTRAGRTTDMLSGMMRNTASYAKTTGSEFVVFRRLSRNGKPWIHPGIRPRKLAEKIDFAKCISAAFSLAV